MWMMCVLSKLVKLLNGCLSYVILCGIVILLLLYLIYRVTWDLLDFCHIKLPRELIDDREWPCDEWRKMSTIIREVGACQWLWRLSVPLTGVGFLKKQIHRKNNNLIFLGLPRISLNNLGSFKVCIKITLKSNLLSKVWLTLQG